MKKIWTLIFLLLAYSGSLFSAIRELPFSSYRDASGGSQTHNHVYFGGLFPVITVKWSSLALTLNVSGIVGTDELTGRRLWARITSASLSTTTSSNVVLTDAYPSCSYNQAYAEASYIATFTCFYTDPSPCLCMQRHSHGASTSFSITSILN